MHRIQDLIRLRPEVQAGRLHGIVSLYALLDEETPNAFERDSERVLAATFPSRALQRLLRRLQVSLTQQDADRKGNFIISGGYGAGKSHLLLTLYHLLAHPSKARDWLTKYDIDFTPPDESVVVLMPMTNLTRSGSYTPVEYLWEPIFAALDYTGFQHTGSNFPTIADLRQAVAGRRVFLIIDEIERWFMPIKDKHQAEANVSFLQNLSEFARDADNGLFMLLTLLMLEPRIHNIVGRDDAFFEDLTGAPDRRKVVLHRLVEAVEDPSTVESIVDAYLKIYRQVESHVQVGDYNHYREEILECYPFHPATIEAVFERYSSVARKEETSYQNSRGALYLLAHVLHEVLPPSGDRTGGLQDRDLLLPGDISLSIDRIVDDLINLEPRLVEVARENAARSSNEKVAHAETILSTVLLHSLGDPQAERRLGAEFGDILLGTVRPSNGHSGVTPASVQMALQNLEATALNLHLEQNPTRWRLRTEINIMAQINRRARLEMAKSKESAKSRIIDTLKDLVGGTVYIHPGDEIPDRKDLTLILTTKRMESEEILDELYYGRAYPNALVIVDPRHMVSVVDDPDLQWMAQRIIAAEQLRADLLMDKEAQKRIGDFLDGMNGLRQNLREQLQDRYGAWRAPIYDAYRGDLTFTRAQVRLDRGAILREVEQRYDASRFRQNIMEVVRSRSTPPTVGEVRAEFLRQRSFAKPVHHGRPSDEPIDQAIRDLVARTELEVIKGGSERYICGKDPGTLQSQWTIAEPPEEHKPHLDLSAAVYEILKNKPEGVTVRELRNLCHEAAAQFPEEELDNRRIDGHLTDLLTRQEIESSAPATPIFGPLADEVVLRYPTRGDKSSTSRRRRLPTASYDELTFGAASVAQMKTDVIERLNKIDKLSHVHISARCTLQGADLVAQKDLVGLGNAALGDARLALDWALKDAPVTDRDDLIALLNRLPYSSLLELTIQLRREKT